MTIENTLTHIFLAATPARYLVCSEYAELEGINQDNIDEILTRHAKVSDGGYQYFGELLRDRIHGLGRATFSNDVCFVG